MVRDLVEGINIFGADHWEDIKSAYDFPQSPDTLRQYWNSLCEKEQVSMTNKKSMLQCKLSCKHRRTSSAKKGIGNNLPNDPIWEK